MATRRKLEDVLVEHAKIDAEYQHSIAHFKLEFGNDRHIQIRDAVELTNKLQHEAELIIQAQRGGAKALSDVVMMKHHVIQLIEGDRHKLRRSD